MNEIRVKDIGGDVNEPSTYICLSYQSDGWVFVFHVLSVDVLLQEGLFDSSFRHSTFASSIITTFNGVKSQNS